MDKEWHTCHFCGEDINKEGYDPKGERHFLSDCRPDLVEHEIGDTCTWSYKREYKNAEGTAQTYPEQVTCYAYQDSDRNWTKEHTHFYPDGPM